MIRQSTTAEMACCLAILKDAVEPIIASELAQRLGLVGRRESLRRHIRTIIHQLRDDGAWIVSCKTVGYWLTRDAAAWERYQDKRTIEAKHIIGESQRRKRQSSEPGQGMLFEPELKSEVSTGWD